MINYIAYSLISISIFIMLIYGVKRNNNFINIINIIKDHFKIFDGANKHIIVIYILPILTSVGLSLIYSLTDSMIEAIMVVISVVISALLTFQGVIMNIETKDNEDRKKELLEETNSSINFIVLINIFLVFLMLIYIAIEDKIWKKIFTTIIIYLLIITFLTILIIFKRIRVLLKSNIK